MYLHCTLYTVHILTIQFQVRTAGFNCYFYKTKFKLGVCFRLFKGTVQRDFRPPVFFLIRTSLGHLLMGWNIFDFSWDLNISAASWSTKLSCKWVVTGPAIYLARDLSCFNGRNGPHLIDFNDPRYNLPERRRRVDCSCFTNFSNENLFGNKFQMEVD